MKNALIKTAAVMFVAAIAASGSAFAQDPTTDDKINAEITASHEMIYSLVSTSVEDRIAELQLKNQQAEADQSTQSQTNATS